MSKGLKGSRKFGRPEPVAAKPAEAPPPINLTVEIVKFREKLVLARTKESDARNEALRLEGAIAAYEALIAQINAQSAARPAAPAPAQTAPAGKEPAEVLQGPGAAPAPADAKKGKDKDTDDEPTPAVAAS